MKIRITEILREKKMTALELAQKCGMSTVGISKIATGKSFPYPSTIEKLTKALDVPAWQLFVEPVERQGNLVVCPHCGKVVEIEINVKK